MHFENAYSEMVLQYLWLGKIYLTGCEEPNVPAVVLTAQLPLVFSLK